MKLTEYQNTCVEKAKRYKKKNMLTKLFRALYIDTCTDGYIPAAEFVAMVNETSVITPKTEKQPIRDWISSFERDVLGKGITKEEHRLNVRKNYEI